jgi:hypothetical protein
LSHQNPCDKNVDNQGASLIEHYGYEIEQRAPNQPVPEPHQALCTAGIAWFSTMTLPRLPKATTNGISAGPRTIADTDVFLINASTSYARYLRRTCTCDETARSKKGAPF